jgi:putative transposase
MPVEQYTALAFTEQLAEAGIAGSIGTVGDALDNALMESTIGLYKTEWLTTCSAREDPAIRS